MMISPYITTSFEEESEGVFELSDNLYFHISSVVMSERPKPVRLILVQLRKKRNLFLDTFMPLVLGSEYLSIQLGITEQIEISKRVLYTQYVDNIALKEELNKLGK